MQVYMSLLDYLAYRTGCGFLSDMHYFQKGEREYLCRILQQISPEDASLQEWNDALTYLTDAMPEASGASGKGTVACATVQTYRTRAEIEGANMLLMQRNEGAR